MHTNRKALAREIKETILITIASKRIKHFRLYLTKEVKDLYTENYETVMKGIEEIEINVRIFHIHRLEELVL